MENGDNQDSFLWICPGKQHDRVLEEALKGQYKTEVKDGKKRDAFEVDKESGESC